MRLELERSLATRYGDPQRIGGTGGGVRCFSAAASLIVFNSTIEDNSAAISGGGLHSEGCTLIVLDSRVEGNVVLDGFGGGISIRFAGGNVISGTAIRENAAGSGGGLSLTAGESTQAAYVHQSSIAGNAAIFGGGIDSAMRLHVVNSVVAENTGTYGGGGGIRTFEALILASSTVFGNSVTSTTNSAGVYLQGSSPSIVFDHTILAGQPC